MELRGFDSYEVSLGDEMRGERASRGKSISQAENDMRIKARTIEAIENCDLDAFPNQSVIAGYVRSYARYLGMDADDCYRRFCLESGYQSPSALHGLGGSTARGKSPKALGGKSGIGSEIAQSRFAAPPATNRFMTRISLGALTSSAALLALIAGLSYGGYALLQDIQRVGFAPLPDAPSVVANAPEIDAPTIDMQALERPQADDYRGGGALATAAPLTDLPILSQARRDGPISAINPETAGIFARLQEQEPPIIDTPDASIMLASVNVAEDAASQSTEPRPEPIRGVSIVAGEEAWVQIREADNTILYTATMAAGDSFDLPLRVDSPILKAGNAGGVFLYVDGVAYGPLGKRGHVARGVSLLADDIRGTVPVAEGVIAVEIPVPEEQQRAEALLQD
ncbi:MAG: RodZ domain-containing protein [Pseudomonadota bacterium]